MSFKLWLRVGWLWWAGRVCADVMTLQSRYLKYVAGDHLTVSHSFAAASSFEIIWESILFLYKRCSVLHWWKTVRKYSLPLEQGSYRWVCGDFQFFHKSTQLFWRNLSRNLQNILWNISPTKLIYFKEDNFYESFERRLFRGVGQCPITIKLHIQLIPYEINQILKL